MSSIQFSKAQYGYDDEVDVLIIYETEDYIYDSSIELDQDIIMDYDHDGIPVAIELLHTSKIFKVPKDSLKTIENLQGYAKVTEKLIFVEFTFEVSFNNEKQTCFFDSTKSNDISLPNLELKIT
jgi:uncharacterized protein YuzE